MRSGAPAMASTSGRAAHVGTHHPRPMRRSTRYARPLEPPPVGLSFAGRTARGRCCSHVVWYKRNEWIKYMPEKHNPHDYDDPATFAELEELVTGILLRFPEGVNRRKLLRILDQQGHYFGGMEGQTLAYHLIHRMQDGDLAWWVERELKDDIIYPIDWEHLKSQERRVWRAEYALRLAEEAGDPTPEATQRAQRLLADAPPDFIQRKRQQERAQLEVEERKEWERKVAPGRLTRGTGKKGTDEWDTFWS